MNGVEFFYDPTYGTAIMHHIGHGYYEFGEVCPSFWSESEPPNLTGFIKYTAEGSE